MTPSQIPLDLIPQDLLPLTSLESKLIAAAPTGRAASDFDPEAPLDMAQIGDAQAVRSELLAWLLTASEAQGVIHHKGIRLHGAKIQGVLDLADAHLAYPLRLTRCIFEEKIILERGKFALLDLSGCQTGAIAANSIQVTHDILMGVGFHAKGEVRLLGANIGGDLDCSAGEFENPTGIALFGDRLTTNGSVVLRDGFKARGGVRLLGANIGSQLDCGAGVFENPEGIALGGDGLTTKGNVFLCEGFKSKGEVRLSIANIAGQIVCSAGEFDNPGGAALTVDGVTIGNNVYLNSGFKANGTVRLRGASISGQLDCIAGEFENPGGIALNGDALTTNGHVLMRDGFKAKGEVVLRAASIGGQMDCSSGEFENTGGTALNGDGLITNGPVFLRNGFKAKGGVRLLGANISGQLDCSRGEFNNPEGRALNAEGIKVTGFLFWRQLRAKPVGGVNLTNADLSSLGDDIESWPEPGKLSIDGLTYGPFVADVPADARSRLQWLGLRNPSDTSVQPYEQLIRVFRQMGLQEDARQVAIARQRVLHRQRRGFSRFGSWLLGVTTDYGYRPQKVVLRFILPILALGILVFAWASSAGLMQPAGDPPATLFDPLAYSVDVFLPIVDLHQEDAWQPDTAMANGIYVQYYMYFHILAGWFFTTLLVAAVTGLVRRE